MIKFRTHYDEVVYEDGERNVGKSKTIPGQAMSVREILRRYSQGLSFDGMRVGTYDEEIEGLPDFSKMDLSEIQDFKEFAAAQVKAVRDRQTEVAEENRKKATIEMYNRWKAEEEAKKNEAPGVPNDVTPS